MSDSFTIGVDHGYYAVKTAHCSFPTGLVEYEYEPYTRKNVLEFGGKYYVVGSGRPTVQPPMSATMTEGSSSSSLWVRTAAYPWGNRETAVMAML